MEISLFSIDCGSSGGNGMASDDVEYWLGNSINNVVAIFISHAQQDHYRYLPNIRWNSASINAVIIGGTVQNYRSRGAAISDWINDYDNQGKVYTIGTVQSSPSSCIGNCIVATSTDFCNNGNFQFNILAANAGSTPNQLSPVIKIVASSGWSLLLSGDMEGQASRDISDQLGDGLQSLVYKMSHHGAVLKQIWMTGSYLLRLSMHLLVVVITFATVNILAVIQSTGSLN